VNGEAELADPPDRLLDRQLSGLLIAQVKLEPDPVEGDAALQEVTGEGNQRLELRVRRVRPYLVVEELDGRVRLAGDPKGLLEPVVADHPLPHAVAAPTVVCERLVHDVPGRDAATVVRQDGRDVLTEDVEQRGPCPAPRLDPGGVRVVVAPDERVTVHLLPVRLGEGDHRVPPGEFEPVPARPQVVHLHVVLRGQRVIELQGLPIPWVRVADEGRPADRRAELDRAAARGCRSRKRNESSEDRGERGARGESIQRVVDANPQPTLQGRMSPSAILRAR
jgi:hypothetical protein